MKSLAFFLAVLTLAAGCVLEDKPVIPADGGVEAGPCRICELETPICNDDLQCVECTAESNSLCLEKMLVCKTDAFECVECNTSSDCNLEKMLVCKTDAFECVECNASSDCNDPAAAGCNTELNECEGCQSEADCIGIEGRPVCDDRTCVQCTPGTEDVDCGGKSCDPRTRECTETTLASRETCETCVSDSECKEAGNRCVAMTYQGLPFPDALTGFCLKTFSEGDPCERPYLVPLLGRESLSGPPAANFCGIDETNVTCPAVLALLNNVECPSGEDSECPISGLCRDFVDGLAEDRCTYLCSDADECKKPPVAGSTCGSSGLGDDDYCGG